MKEDIRKYLLWIRKFKYGNSVVSAVANCQLYRIKSNSKKLNRAKEEIQAK